MTTSHNIRIILLPLLLCTTYTSETAELKAHVQQLSISHKTHRRASASPIQKHQEVFNPKDLPNLIIPTTQDNQPYPSPLRLLEKQLSTSPISPQSEIFFSFLPGLFKKIGKSIHAQELNPTYTIPTLPNYPLLACFKPKLNIQEIIQDLRLLPIDEFSDASPQTIAFSPKTERPSFFNPSTTFAVWYSKTQPNTGIVQKISNKNITDWYILGDRHGDGASIDIFLNFLATTLFLRPDEEPQTYLSKTGKLAPHVGIIFLGDYIDRGEDSLGVLHRIIQLRKHNTNQVFLLKGNHEEGECGCGLQENLASFGPSLSKLLHHCFITGLSTLPEMFFLEVPNENNQESTKAYLALTHGGINSFSLEKPVFNAHMPILQALLSNPNKTITTVAYPDTMRHAALWGDFSVTESDESALLSKERKFSIGRKDVELFLAQLDKPQQYKVEGIIRAHQQATKHLFRDIQRIPGIATRFPKSKGDPSEMHNLKNYLVTTLNVAPRTALAFAQAYKDQYELSFDTILHLHTDWNSKSWTTYPTHFNSETGQYVSHKDVTEWFTQKQQTQLPISWIAKWKELETAKPAPTSQTETPAK